MNRPSIRTTKQTSFPAHKSSGMDWIESIPEGWHVASLRWISHRYAGGTPDRDNLGYWEEGAIPWVNSGAVNQWLITEPSTLITELGFRESSTRWIPEGALVMALAGQGKTKGMVAQVGFPVCCNQSVVAICPAARVDPRFLLWWLHSQYQRIRGMAGDVQRDGLNLEMVGSIPCLLPSIEEQVAIAVFLDRETARIDALVEKKRHQIELLKEKRAALISHAVTKGLDPNAVMKGSGIEWLGFIPSHWPVVRLGYFAGVQNGSTPSRMNTEYWTDGVVPWLSSSKVNEDIIVEPSEWITETAKRESNLEIIPSGSVVIGLVGQGRTRGMSALMAIAATINQNMAAITPGSRLTGRYLHYLLQHMYDPVRENGRGANQPALNCELVADLQIVLPPVGEQKAIAASLDQGSKAVSVLCQKIEGSIDRLREYRSALISAAIIGKIDVREEVV